MMSDQSPDLDSLWDFDRLEDTEKLFQDLLAGINLGSSDQSLQIELLTQIARAKALLGHLEGAEHALKEAEALLKDSRLSYRTVAKLRYLLEKSRIYILRKTPSQARPLLIDAWTLAGNSGEDFHSIDAAQMLAAIEPQKKQQEWIQKALALAETSPQERAKSCLGELYTTHGWTQFEARQFETSLETFKKALSCVKAQNIPRKIIAAKWAVAKTLRALQRTEEALDIQKDLLAEVNILNQKDGYIYEELAECLQSLRRSNEAQVYFDLAYRELSKDSWLSDNKPDRLKRLKSLGKSK